MVHQRCMTIIYQLVKASYPQFENLPNCWIECYDLLQSYRVNSSYSLVNWVNPSTSTLKYNTDGACRGNSRESSYGFCYRDCAGDVLYAESGTLRVTTNIVAEATTIRNAIGFGITQQYQHTIIELMHSLFATS